MLISTWNLMLPGQLFLACIPQFLFLPPLWGKRSYTTIFGGLHFGVVFLSQSRGLLESSCLLEPNPKKFSDLFHLLDRDFGHGVLSIESALGPLLWAFMERQRERCHRTNASKHCGSHGCTHGKADLPRGGSLLALFIFKILWESWSTLLTLASGGAGINLGPQACMLLLLLAGWASALAHQVF